MRKADSVAESASVLVKRTMREIRGELANLSTELNLAGSASDREKVYGEIRRRMALLSRRMNKLMEAQNELAARSAAASASKMTGLEVKYSPKRAEAITELVTPAQGENLAAVFTDRMGRNLINSLREATVGMLREQAVAGGSMKDMARDLAARWSQAAKVDDPRFTDASGRTWDTRTYIQMNVRTNTMRVYNDCLLDDVAREVGTDLMRISSGGDPDCDCAAWEGVIISVSGQTKGLPTYEDARNAGCFHPNCTHTLEYVDEVADKKEIELQKAHPVQEGLADDPDAQDERKYEIDQARYMRDNPGMTQEEARIAVDRDNLAASIQSGLVRDDAREIVAKMTDAQVTALCPDGNPPAFEPTKRATRADPHAADEKWNHGSRGGTVHIGRDADLAHILGVCKVEDADGKGSATSSPADSWTPQTDLEKATDALMRSIGVKHTEERMDPLKGNPEYDPGEEKYVYRINCQRCVPTAEARLRGYDVEALPSLSTDRHADEQTRKLYEGLEPYSAEWLFPTFKDAQPIRYRKREDIEKQMKEWGDGARAQIVCKWSGRNSGAHTFMAVQENGKTVFIDPQSAKQDCSSHFDGIMTRGTKAMKYNKFARIDNLHMNDRMKLCCKPTTSE